MKKIVALWLALSMMFALCACGKSEAVKNAEEVISKISEVTLDSEAAILLAEDTYGALPEEEKDQVGNYSDLVAAREAYLSLAAEAFIGFVAEHPCFTEKPDYAKQFVDVELVSAYKGQLEEIRRLEIDKNRSPEFADAVAYAEAVKKLEEYAKYNDFILCLYQTQELVQNGVDVMSEVLNAGSNANATVAFSKFNSAATSFENAQKIAEGFDQSSERVAEVTKCYEMFSNGATNMASGLYMNNDFIFNTGAEAVQKQATVYYVLWVYGASLINEVEEIGAPFIK